MYGFYSLLESVGDPEHEQYAEMVDWLGEDFDPEAFSIDEVNGRLGYMRRRRSKAEGA